jgi:hypothetical protein
MLQLPSSPPDYSFNPPPGTTVAELQQHLLKSVYIATTTTDLLEGDHGRLVLITQMMMAQTLGEHPVFKRGSAQDILEATQVRLQQQQQQQQYGWIAPAIYTSNICDLAHYPCA